MKRFLMVLNIFLLTGCLGEVGQGYITKECNKTENINGFNVSTSIEIKSKEGDVESLKITEVYDIDDLSSIINSKMSEQNLYSQLNGVSFDMDSNSFVYDIDVNNADDVIIEKFNIKDKQYKQIEYYESIGYVCK